MTGFKVISTSILEVLTEVRLYAQTIDHVVNQHPEIPALLPVIGDAVSTAIINPTHVERGHSNSYVFVDAESTNASGDPLRVPVKPVEGTSGRVKTFYFASTETEPEILWRRPDDQG